MRSRTFIGFVAFAAFGCSWDYSIWIPRHASADALYRFVKGDKAGYIDASGRVVIRPRFKAFGNGGGEFRNGLLETDLSGGKYVDRTGHPVDPGLYRGWDFSEGLAAANRKGEDKWGFIDVKGNFVIAPRFDRVSSFAEGLAQIEVNKQMGFVDRTGAVAIQPHFLQRRTSQKDSRVW